jgi:hypothetical protein
MSSQQEGMRVLKPADRSIADEWAVTVDAVFALLAAAAVCGDAAEVGRLRSVARAQLRTSAVLSAHVLRCLGAAGGMIVVAAAAAADGSSGTTATQQPLLFPEEVTQ